MLHDQIRLVLRARRAHCDCNDALVATSREALDRSYNLLRLTAHMVDPHELMMRRAVEAPQGPLRSISVADDIHMVREHPWAGETSPGRRTA